MPWLSIYGVGPESEYNLNCSMPFVSTFTIRDCVSSRVQHSHIHEHCDAWIDCISTWKSAQGNTDMSNAQSACAYIFLVVLSFSFCTFALKRVLGEMMERFTCTGIASLDTCSTGSGTATCSDTGLGAASHFLAMVSRLGPLASLP